MFQDWTETKWDKREDNRKKDGYNKAQQRTSRMDAASAAQKRLDQETDVKRREKIDLSISKAIQQARMGAKLTQAQLAQRMNIKPAIIGAYESGKVVPSGAFISRIERAIGGGVRLPRPKKKSKKAAN